MTEVELEVYKICEICNGNIIILIFRGTGVCCENCRKERVRRLEVGAKLLQVDTALEINETSP
jgi:hypothetical protein